jgi:multicomponent Na+:H+ antiporter subunit A
VLPLGLSLLSLALTSLIFSLIRPHRFKHIGWLAALPPAAITVWLLLQLPAVAAGEVIVERYAWAPALGLEVILRLDGLGIFFGMIIAGIGAAVALYTGYYLEHEPRQGYFYALLYLFMASMLGIVWADNLLLLFVAWEGTSITSYLLIGFNDTQKAARDGSRRALIVTTVGGLCMLFGMVMLGSAAGTYTISEILADPEITGAPLYGVALALLFMGAFTKSAQFPFHFWLPGAMAAPTPASAYLHSATMVKAGVYLLARLHPALSDDPRWFWTLLVIGGITMLIGAIAAMGNYDLKGLLAYATVSQLGILVLLLAFSSEIAATAAVVGTLAHALYKGPLFLVAGIVDHATGSRDLRRLGNLRTELPLVTGVALLAALSMGGMPPLFGFVAKETLLETMYEFTETGALIVGWAGMVALILTGAFFVAYSFTLLWEAFLRGRPATGEPVHVHHAPSFSFVFGPLLLTLVGTAIPFFLVQVEALLFDPPATVIEGEEIHAHLLLWHGFTPVLMFSLIAIALGVVIFLGRSSVRRVLGALPPTFNGAYAFDKIVYATYDLARWVTRRVQGGTLAGQAAVILGAAFVALLFALTAGDWRGDIQLLWPNPPSLAEVILAALAVIAAIVTVRARTRLSAIISIGVVGVAITLFFVFFSAPDLALTQLLVDVLTVVLLVLVFYRIPPRTLPPIPRARIILNAALATAVGIFGFFLVLFSAGTPYFPPIADYFSLNSVALGHGANIVNVILVDFRGFDTMGEITVLAIAAVGGYAVLRSALFRVRPTVLREPEPEDDPAKT